MILIKVIGLRPKVHDLLISLTWLWIVSSLSVNASNKEYGSTSKAFIFSLHNKEKLAPFKSMVRNPGRAIYRYRFYGPTFGTDDLLIDKDRNTRAEKTKTDFGIDYCVPENVNDRKTILAGVHQFHPDEVEVFYLNWYTRDDNRVLQSG